MYDPGALSPSEIIDLLTEIADELAHATAGLSAEQLGRRTPGQDRSILDICRRVREEAQRADGYLQRLTGEATRTLDIPSASEDSDTIGTHIDALRLIRAQTVALLAKLDPAMWRRSGDHPDFGQMTVEEVALRLIQHEERALDEIAEIKHALRE